MTEKMSYIYFNYIEKLPCIYKILKHIATIIYFMF